MIALGVISVVENGRARVTLSDRGVQTPPLRAMDGRTFTGEDLGKPVLVAFWSSGLGEGAILGVLT